jgi:5-methyltetrahydropteroyltriglutamate--homocysteine methyltransferase
MGLPTEPIGSIPRPPALLAGIAEHAAGHIGREALDTLFVEAVRDTIATLESLGSPVIDGGAHAVQMDFTEGRLSIKLDPSGGVLRSFVALINRVLDRFTDAERARIGVHTCPGGDQDSTHSLDIDYTALLPNLFEIRAGVFYLQLASEPDQDRVLAAISTHARSDQRIFVGVTDPIDPVVETAEQVRDRVLRAAEHIPPERLGTCDDCGFAPFGDDTSTSRDTAFAKVRARIEGTLLADERLGA